MMCEYCHTLPHLPGCPNEPDPKPVAYCDCCCEGIYPGVKWADNIGGLI